MIRAFLTIGFVCGLALQAQAQQNELTFIYLVRHAEKQSGKDPELTPEGDQRAKNYADTFAQSGIQHVFSTDYKRTRQTAQPLAHRLKLKVEAYNPKDLPGMAKRLLSLNKTVMVVGHSNTTHALVAQLGGNAGDAIDEPSEFNRVYQLVIKDGKVIHTNRFVSSNR